MTRFSGFASQVEGVAPATPIFVRRRRAAALQTNQIPLGRSEKKNGVPGTLSRDAVEPSSRPLRSGGWGVDGVTTTPNPPLRDASLAE